MRGWEMGVMGERGEMEGGRLTSQHIYRWNTRHRRRILILLLLGGVDVMTGDCGGSAPTTKVFGFWKT